MVSGVMGGVILFEMGVLVRNNTIREYKALSVGNESAHNGNGKGLGHGVVD